MSGILNFKTPLALPPQLQWKRVNEPELMSWRIRARNYNTFVANIVFALLLLLTLAASTFLYWAYHDIAQFWRLTWCVLFYILIALMISSMTHQKNELRLSLHSFRIRVLRVERLS